VILTVVLCSPRFSPVRSCAAIVDRVTRIIPPQIEPARRVAPCWLRGVDLLASATTGPGACAEGVLRPLARRRRSSGHARRPWWPSRDVRTGVVTRCMTHAQQLAPGCHVEPRLDRARGRARGECHCESFGCLAACVLWLKCVEREMIKEVSWHFPSRRRCSRRRTGAGPAPIICDPITSGQADRRSEVHITGVGAIVITAPQHPRASNARHAQRHLLLPPPPTAPLCFP